jgi:hypothetical protein
LAALASYGAQPLNGGRMEISPAARQFSGFKPENQFT